MNRRKLEFTVCHRMPERSFFWKGKQFPVCARCTGIYIGYLSVFVFAFFLVYINIWVSVLLIIPTITDGMTQAFCNRESNNLLRAVTGFFAGIGIMSVVAMIGQYMGKQLVLFFYNL